MARPGPKLCFTQGYEPQCAQELTKHVFQYISRNLDCVGARVVLSLPQEYNRGRANYDAVIGHWPEYIENLAADTSFSASHPSGKKGARSSRKSLSPTKAAKGRKGKRGSGDDGGKGGESPRAGAVSPRAGEESPRVAEFGSSMTEFRSSLQEFRSSRTRFESPSIRLPAI